MKKLIYLLALSFAISSCMKEDKQGDDKSAYNAKRMADFYEKVMNAHDPSMVDSFCTEDFKEHMPAPGYPPDREGLKAFFRDWFNAFPDMKVDLKWVKAFGDTTMAYASFKGMNSGVFMGRPATNKKIDVEGVDFVIIKDGKATEHWGFLEEGKMMAQMAMDQGPPMMDSTGVKK